MFLKNNNQNFNISLTCMLPVTKPHFFTPRLFSILTFVPFSLNILNPATTDPTFPDPLNTIHPSLHAPKTCRRSLQS